MEAGDIADSGRTSHELCDKRCLRLAVDFDRRSRLFDMSMVGYDDLICNLNCLILIMRDKNAGDAVSVRRITGSDSASQIPLIRLIPPVHPHAV